MNFDDFERRERRAVRGIRVMMTMAAIWMLFLVGAISTAIWMVGSSLGVW